MKLNQNYANLQESYLFLTIAKKVAAYTEAHPDNHIIRMGIGDVTQPLVPAVIEAMHKATDEMAHKETFHGYSPDQGYDFLREAIQGYYAKRGVALKLSEIFVGDGAKSDVGNNELISSVLKPVMSAISSISSQTITPSSSRTRSIPCMSIRTSCPAER